MMIKHSERLLAAARAVVKEHAQYLEDAYEDEIAAHADLNDAIEALKEIVSEIELER